ncbi:glucokinase [Limnoraphis robusta]|uniref:Glucokinase n=1 Tax=Limnoraphis robusta CCNP1315 TaxID=3110306 RepID=A0ABU5TZD0_9CYAN|nr:glucokinase [Limnoraphis robusta]MEA5520292.1 glucokinase [Limnoraphis robusta CCNP1315]MEA5548558.1 glucokinase [Limnoraphis robusta CCNP1324]
MTILLAGDIGGTKTILCLVKAEPSESLKPIPLLTTLYEHSYASQAYCDLTPIVIEFLDSAEKSLGTKYIPEKACFGIAGPVVNNTCDLTNLSWFLDAKHLEQELNLSKVKLINDFAAIGYGVVGLTPEDLRILQAGEPDATAPIAVIGAGTGLGEGFVIPTAGAYYVFSTEGGHVDFAPRSELEFQLLSYVRELNNISRVSVERIVSGMGIAAIYQFMRDRNSSLETPEMAEVFKTWKQEMGKGEKTVDLGAEISKAAARDDYLCEQTMKLFVDAYGTEAGNMALKLLPYGGLYIAGGIAAKNLDLMEQGIFMKAFTSKGRISPLMEKVPVYIVLNPKVGLIGAALCAAQLV